MTWPIRHVAISPKGTKVSIGPLPKNQRVELFELFSRIVADGEGFPHSAPLTWATFEDTWVKPVTTVVAATVDGALAGAYYLRPNFPGRGAHIANAGYFVAFESRGFGVGRLLVEDSIGRAPTLGFDAVQFNFVFASNPARRLYEELGWHEIGRIPDGIPGDDCIIYWRAV